MTLPLPETAGQSTQADPYDHPTKECDLVLKGGITSGVVYPRAILELAKTYRLRSIGGSSSGAIAAGFAAAAEFGRESGGFAKLGKFGDWLGAGTHLRDLFQAPEPTRPLMNTFLQVLTHLQPKKNTAPTASPQPAEIPPSPAVVSQSPPAGGTQPTQAAGPRPVSSSWPPAWVRWAWQHVPAILESGDQTYFRRGAWIGAVALAVVMALLVLGLLGAVSVVTQVTWGRWVFVGIALLLGAVGAYVGWQIGGTVNCTVHLSSLLLGTLPQQTFFGIATGHKTPGDIAQPDTLLLTDWMCNSLEDLAGHRDTNDPLTFRDLKQEGPQGEQGEKGIDLRIVTTNLSHGQPYVLPRPEDKNAFIFKEDEWDLLFPTPIMDYLVREAAHKEMPLPTGYHFLPAGDALPVVVALRLSLSFPLLLSTVPLYTINPAAFAAYHDAQKRRVEFRFDATNDLQRNLFSDAGLCCDFPIQFFDNWLPTRPTFGINLTTLPTQLRSAPAAGDTTGIARSADAAAGSANEVKPVPKVFLPQANDPQYPEWRKIDDLPTFGLAIFDSARNFRDTMQAQLPSYRERIVQIRLTPEEGGLNLAMDPSMVTNLEQRGEDAANLLLDPAKFDFDHHKWVRLRMLTHLLEEHLADLPVPLAQPVIDELFDTQRTHTTPVYPYREASATWCAAAKVRISQLRRLADEWAAENQKWFSTHNKATAAAEANSLAPASPSFFADPSRAEPKAELRVTPEL